MRRQSILKLCGFVLIIVVLAISAGCSSAGQDNDSIAREINEKLQAIANNPKAAFSSNPYDYIKDNKDYEFIVNQGEKGLHHMLRSFSESNANGLREYVMAIACSEILGENQEDKRWSSGRQWYENYLSGGNTGSNIGIKGNILDVYTAALDSFMLLDEGLNGGMKYISIDSATLEHLSLYDVNMLLRHFERYNVEVKDASLEELKEMGLFDEKSRSIEGVLLGISDFKIISSERVVMEGSKFRSGLGAIGIRCTLQYNDGRWQVENAVITWIS